MAKRRIIPLFIPHAGCPSACVFCDQKKISGETTPVTPEMVRREIENALPFTGEGAELAFYGGSFTAMPVTVQNGLLSPAKEYLDKGLLGAVRLSTRPDAVDVETALRLKDYGVTTVELGCQSLNDRVLQLTNRGHDAACTSFAVKCLKAVGISVILQMMTGLPGDSGGESLETAEEIIALSPDGVRIYPTVVIRGTKLEEMMKAGTYQPQTVEEATELCAVLYEKFRQNHIPVIRVGLNPTGDLSGGEAVAGAYHPALGELVLSRMYRNRAEKLLGEFQGETVCLSVHPSRVSVMVGQKKCNMEYLRQLFPEKSLKVRGDGAELWEITLKE